MIGIQTVIAKLHSQGCHRRGDLDDQVSLYFEFPLGSVFSIPKPLENDQYNSEQLTEIQSQVEFRGIDLLPLDPNH
ncbi:MAG: hypothetical protein OXQ29_07910 [Rhodospirillaceae bacterium]|nr:hypothetical protein [Rhodospirillaceae bacterium]